MYYPLPVPEEERPRIEVYFRGQGVFAARIGRPHDDPTESYGAYEVGPFHGELTEAFESAAAAAVAAYGPACAIQAEGPPEGVPGRRIPDAYMDVVCDDVRYSFIPCEETDAVPAIYAYRREGYIYAAYRGTPAAMTHEHDDDDRKGPFGVYEMGPFGPVTEPDLFDKCCDAICAVAEVFGEAPETLMGESPDGVDGEEIPEVQIA